MKAITLWQPWASLIAIGAKRIETRNWATRYRGPLAIHASKRVPWDIEAFYAEEPLPYALIDAGYETFADLPFGVVLATCRLVDVLPTTDEFLTNVLLTPEWNYGDYSPGRFAWLLDDITRLDPPVTASGRQGLWEWSNS